MSLVPGIIGYSNTPVITYATWNPSKKGPLMALSNGNLTASGKQMVLTTVGVNSGKWYWEVKIDSTAGRSAIGVANNNVSLITDLGKTADGWCYGRYISTTSGIKIHNNSYVNFGGIQNAGDIVGVALDMDSGIIHFYKNNILQVVDPPYIGITGTIYPAVGSLNGFAVGYTANFGQNSFVYSPPSGYNAGIYQ